MKVLVFPALLAVAIITTPPKPFAQAPASKPLMATSTPASKTGSLVPAQQQVQPVPATKASTARR